MDNQEVSVEPSQDSHTSISTVEVISDASRNSSSGNNIGIPPSSSTGSLPKLRLTLRVPSSSTLPSIETSAPSSAKKKKGPAPGFTKGTKKPSTSTKGKATTLVPSQLGATAEVTGQSTTASASQVPGITRPYEKRELPAQFSEQIEQLKVLRNAKTRKWMQAETSITTLSGATLVLPIWAREGSFQHHSSASGATDNGSRRASIDGSLDVSESYQCDICKKTFDMKDKWRRHQLVHKKKLQLKLPNWKLVHKASENEEAADPASELMSEDGGSHQQIEELNTVTN